MYYQRGNRYVYIHDLRESKVIKRVKMDGPILGISGTKDEVRLIVKRADYGQYVKIYLGTLDINIEKYWRKLNLQEGMPV